ncbi:glycosyltransferase family 4 protein [Candidatus Kaiserbacteria bacterium]|nr:glycosyltransferase family 4 protein [Candidatus Kaiserbacteria bacterium]
MKIVLAASIYPPEIGGPAFYAANLKEALEKQGHTVSLAIFSRYKSLPSGFRHLRYLFELMRSARGSNLIIAFDPLTVGFPAAIVGLFMQTPVVVRVGGDFIWERHIERTGGLIPLSSFYLDRQKWNTKEKLLLIIIRWVLARSQIAFSSQWIRDIWQPAYRFDTKDAHVIENAIPSKVESLPHKRKNFLFYGRQIQLKNARAFRRAFVSAKSRFPAIELEEGLLPQNELMQRMQSCYAVVLPSISDVTPNYILDAIRCGKPFLLTKYSSYAGEFKDYGVVIDPLSEDDMVRGISELADDASYAKYHQRLATFSRVRTYDDIAREFLALA